ncbi:16S rRNA (uracil(1498)-N(3))-methyltransferase, partial [Bacteriovorax sp. DB6_IX]|uniref:16S rRNA (uracil(1498)-N(3))-methyltransferase n=1 Tax=Bacteriovorax sp. DB6_IX TaxID=1353530 RepID=UPI0012FA73F6
YLIVIGPEGGLSNSEEDYILSQENAHSLKIDTPILRHQMLFLLWSVTSTENLPHYDNCVILK